MPDKDQAQTQEPQGGEQPQGGVEPQPQPQPKPEVDIEAIKAQVRKEIEAHISSRLKELVGVESLEDLERKILEEEGKFQELAEQAKKEADTWRTRYQETLKRAEITTLASKLGAVDPEVVLALVAQRAEVTEDGKVLIEGKPAEEALKALLSEKPYLVKASETTGSGTPGTTETDKFAGVKTYEDLLKDSKLLAEFMKERPEEYRKLREEYFASKLA